MPVLKNYLSLYRINKMQPSLGESIPVTKTPLPHTENTMPWKTHSLEDYRKHVLFCGTEVIQVKPSGQGPVRAVVLQTGEWIQLF